MRIGIRSFVAAGKICKVLVLGVVTMAIAIPGRDVALGQAGPGSNPLSNPYAYSRIDVPGATNTAASGINGAGQIVGSFVDTSSLYHGFLRDAGGRSPRSISPARPAPQPPGSTISARSWAPSWTPASHTAS